MPLQGEYAPSTSDWARNQAEEFEASGGTKNGMNGMAIVVVTSVGAKTGKLRKTPLMRVEHDGEYAVVASLGGAPNNPVWYYNLKKNPHVELQDGPVRRRTILLAKFRAKSATSGGIVPSPPFPTTPTTRRKPNG